MSAGQILSNDVSVTPDGAGGEFRVPGTLEELAAEIKAITSSPGWGWGLPYYGSGAPGNTRGPRWTAEDKARHAAAIKSGLARIKSGQRFGKYGDWDHGYPACPVCGSETRFRQGCRLKRYCSNACRQRAYRQRQA